jgi:hypothetical protein
VAVWSIRKGGPRQRMLSQPWPCCCHKKHNFLAKYTDCRGLVYRERLLLPSEDSHALALPEKFIFDIRSSPPAVQLSCPSSQSFPILLVFWKNWTSLVSSGVALRHFESATQNILGANGAFILIILSASFNI